MASELDELIDYYANLLIIQYNSKEKATAEMSLIVRGLLADLVYFDVQDAYDIDTAVGVQLDLLGTYIGAFRGFNKYTFENGAFGLTNYQQIQNNIFGVGKKGFSTYSNFPLLGEIFTYDKKLNILFLGDDDYRNLLKLKIITNNTIASRGVLDNDLFELFGNGIIIISDNDMKVFYSIESQFLDVFTASEEQGFFPKPAGVKLFFSVI